METGFVIEESQKKKKGAISLIMIGSFWGRCLHQSNFIWSSLICHGQFGPTCTQNNPTTFFKGSPFLPLDILLIVSSIFFFLWWRKVEAGLKKYKPDIIISVHPLMQHIPLWVLKWQGLQNRVVFVTVITDLNTCHPTWYSKIDCI